MKSKAQEEREKRTDLIKQNKDTDREVMKREKRKEQTIYKKCRCHRQLTTTKTASSKGTT